MGIQVEFNPDLALRAFGTPERSEAECIPRVLEAGRTYEFQKLGQRNYWLEGEIPLLITRGNQQLSPPIASIKILEATHRVLGDKRIYTEGLYEVVEVFDPNDARPKFNGLERIKP